jgi:RNA polymerase sigma-70 factor (ECF subfamily)
MAGNDTTTALMDEPLLADAPTAGANFNDVVLPHLDAAHRLARWLMRNEHDAEDAVQEALLRALRYFRTFTHGDGRAWFLRIVRNTCLSRRSNPAPGATDLFDEEQHSNDQFLPNPETLLLHADGVTSITRAINELPYRSRELLLLRELEGLSYQELADKLDIPMGTVMSTLWRARQALRLALDPARTPRIKPQPSEVSVHKHARQADSAQGKDEV